MSHDGRTGDIETADTRSKRVVDTRIRLTIPAEWIVRAKTAIRTGASLGSRMTVSFAVRAETVEMLARAEEALEPAPHDGNAVELHFHYLPRCMRSLGHREWRRTGSNGKARIELGLFDERGCSAALVRGGLVHPIDELWMPGAGFERWTPAADVAPFAGRVPADGRFSRFAGALGGMSPVERLQRLRVAVVGVSRIGSLVAVALARVGVRELVLIDHDVLEAHHLDAIEVGARAPLGTPKVQAVAAMLRHLAPDIRVVGVEQRLETSEALRAVASSDVIVTAPDRGRPRMLAALVASAYHRIHVDVGTGVFVDRAGIVAGADVRVLLPGGACALCAGGVTLADEGDDLDWRRQRAGSLRSLNSIAVGHAMLLLERLAIGAVEVSTWHRLQVAADGSLSGERLPARRRSRCEVCARAGFGDGVWRVPVGGR